MHPPIQEAKEFTTLYELITELSEPLDLEMVYNKLGDFLGTILKATPTRILGLHLYDRNFYSIIYGKGDFEFDINKSQFDEYVQDWERINDFRNKPKDVLRSWFNRIRLTSEI